VHADVSCWDVALKRKALQHALKTELSDADRAGLEAYRASLAPAAPTAAAVETGREEGDEQQ
jgi:hypothetical protein